MTTRSQLRSAIRGSFSGHPVRWLAELLCLAVLWARAADPFSDLESARGSPSLPARADPSFLDRLTGEGFSFKKELMFELSRSTEAARKEGDTSDGWYSRQSVGFELLKKFSTV